MTYFDTLIKINKYEWEQKRTTYLIGESFLKLKKTNQEVHCKKLNELVTHYDKIEHELSKLRIYLKESNLPN